MCQARFRQLNMKIRPARKRLQGKNKFLMNTLVDKISSKTQPPTSAEAPTGAKFTAIFPTHSYPFRNKTKKCFYLITAHAAAQPLPPVPPLIPINQSLHAAPQRVLIQKHGAMPRCTQSTAPRGGRHVRAHRFADAVDDAGCALQLHAAAMAL